MSIIIFICIVLLIVAAAAMIFTGFEGFFCGVCLMVLVAVCGIFIPYAAHNNNLATIDNGDAIIKIQEDYKSRMKDQLDSLPRVNSSLMNADSPVSSIVSEIANAEKSIASANSDILDAKMSIQKRNRGMTAYILWFF